MAQPQKDRSSDEVTIVDQITDWAKDQTPTPIKGEEGIEQYNGPGMPEALQKDVDIHIGTVWIHSNL